ncbi:MAG: CRISPR-associated protein Cas4 [Clostridium sp.]|nr:CRISPR-associated protein Cas4 [Clostridium sp.]MCI7444353.1 CRISPR-associated protein Cas4 [Clostridium sp.]
MGANGTLVWFYKICKREVWLMSKNILPDQMDENIDLGRFIHENSYQRKEKEVLFGNVKFDVVFENEDKLVIGETKKTSKYENASKYQLAYYLFVLKDSGINAEGVLLYPEEKKRTKVILTKELEEELKDIIKEIEEIQEKDIPPELKKINFCKNCGYREYCYS